MKNNQAATIYADVLAAMERRKAPFDEIQPLLKSLAELGPLTWSRHVRPHNRHARRGAW